MNQGMPHCPKLIVFCKGQKLMGGRSYWVRTKLIKKKKQSVVGGENQKCQI